MPDASRIDLRSDSVTLPPPAMREAIARAELGDDVYGEDATVNRLERLAADRLGKEAALLAASGTMANLLAILAHCGRGRKVLVGDQSDAWRREAHGASVLGGVGYHPIPTRANGELALWDLEAALDDPSNPECAIAALVCLENTHGMCGGRVLSLEYLADVRAFARGHGLAVHLDGARLFNAAVAQDVPPSTIAAAADSVSFCLSKGLSAPVGSLLVGPAAFIAEARRVRKLLGGGMRQAGIIAAAGLYALEHMVERLAEDHANACRLADGLRELPGLALEQPRPDTNIVFWRLEDPGVTPAAFVAALGHEGVRVLELGRGRIRAVTHSGIAPDDIGRAVARVACALERTRVVGIGGSHG